MHVGNGDGGSQTILAKVFHTLDNVYKSSEGFLCSICAFRGKTKAALSNHFKQHGVIPARVLEAKLIRRRKRPTVKAKLKVLAQLAEFHNNNGAECPRVHFKHQVGYDKSCISRWLQYPRFRQIAALPWLKCLKKLRTTVLLSCSKFRKETDILYQQFLYRRLGKGQEVGGQWLKRKMRAIMAEQQPPGWQNFQASDQWVAVFIKNYQISHQVQTEKKALANSLRVSLLQIFHANLCKLQQSHGRNRRHLVFGRFGPYAIWNIDQIPISFIKVERRSYNPKNTPCWVINHGPGGLEKRIPTLVLTLRVVLKSCVHMFYFEERVTLIASSWQSWMPVASLTPLIPRPGQMKMQLLTISIISAKL